MIIKTYVDQWGGIILDLTGESSHEGTLLTLLASKRMAEHSSSQTASGICTDSNTNLTLTFREHEKIGKPLENIKDEQ